MANDEQWETINGKGSQHGLTVSRSVAEALYSGRRSPPQIGDAFRLIATKVLKEAESPLTAREIVKTAQSLELIPKDTDAKGLSRSVRYMSSALTDSTHDTFLRQKQTGRGSRGQIKLWSLPPSTPDAE